jgi:hypothetical protein
VYAGDLADGHDARDVANFTAPVITNPPHTRKLMHPSAGENRGRS